jgi:hypothetical protein
MYQWIISFGPLSPYCAEPDTGLDVLARQHFGMDRGAAILRREIAPIPSDAPILVIGPGDDWTLTESYYLISYLAWPRPVWSAGLVPRGQKARFENPPPAGVKPAARFVYEIPPPPGFPGRQIGDRLWLDRSSR